MAGAGEGLPLAPSCLEEFTTEWGRLILSRWLEGQGRAVTGLAVSNVQAALNSQQGLLSTTYLVEIVFRTDETEEEEEKKNVFVKIPLTGEAGKNFKQVNVREFEMFTHILPELQAHLDANCEGFFCLSIPELLFCQYKGDEVSDQLVIENLVSSGYVTCETKDLRKAEGGQDYLRSTLETLAQLHGTGLHYKKDVGGREGVLKRFPHIEEQMQIQDIIKNKESRVFIRKHFCAFIRYLEEIDAESDGDLKNITSYMRKLETYLFRILSVLEESGVGNLSTLCHGDAKPNNFMFRKITLEFDEDEFKDYACEGVEAMLIDWQGGFLGSLCNDLMWCIFPFLEVNGHDSEMYEFSIKHYYSELKNVLETFNSSLTDYGLPETVAEFRSLLRRGFVLEFLIVTTLRPVLNITRPEEIAKWWLKLQKYEKAKEAGGIRAFLARKKPELPSQESVFHNERYLEFLQFYFKIATSLGAFQEMGLIYFELMKDSMFGETKYAEFDEDLTEAAKPKVFSKDWFKKFLNISCLKGETDKTENKIETGDKVMVPDKSKIDDAKPGTSDENPYEPVVYDENSTAVDLAVEATEGENKESEDKAEQGVVLEEAEVDRAIIEEPLVERSPSPPDPLRALAAELHGKFANYKNSYKNFSVGMNDYHAEIEEEMKRETEEETKKEEIEVVRKMSQENAWAHVVSGVMNEEKALRQESKVEKEVESEEANSHEEPEALTHAIDEKENKLEFELSKTSAHYTDEDRKCADPAELGVAPVNAPVDINTKETDHPKKEDDMSMKSELKQTIRKISQDIDRSNDKVLETIAFLSSPSDERVDEQKIVTNGTMKKEDEKRQLEMLLDEDENVFASEKKTEDDTENTKDSIMAWLGNRSGNPDVDSEFVYVSPWADEDDKCKSEVCSEGSDVCKDSKEEVDNTALKNTLPLEAPEVVMKACSTLPRDKENCSQGEIKDKEGVREVESTQSVQQFEAKETLNTSEQLTTEGDQKLDSTPVENRLAALRQVLEERMKDDEVKTEISCNEENESTSQIEADSQNAGDCLTEKTSSSDKTQSEQGKETGSCLVDTGEGYESEEGNDEISNGRDEENSDEEDEEVMLLKMMEQLKAAEEAQAAAEEEKIKAERHAEIARTMALREKERFQAEKESETSQSAKKEQVKSTMRSIEEKRQMLAKLKEELAAEREKSSLAQQELVEVSKEMAEEEVSLEQNKEEREKTEQLMKQTAAEAKLLEEKQAQIKMKVEEDRCKVEEAKEEIESARLQAETEAKAKLDEHSRLKEEQALLKEKLRQEQVKIKIAKQEVEEAQAKAEEEEKLKVEEEAKLKIIEHQIEQAKEEAKPKEDVTVQQNCEVTLNGLEDGGQERERKLAKLKAYREAKQKSEEEGRLQEQNSCNLQTTQKGAGEECRIEKEVIKIEGSQKLLALTQPSYASIASQEPKHDLGEVMLPPAPDVVPLKHSTTLPLVVNVEEEFEDVLDTEGFTEVTTRGTKKLQKESKRVSKSGDGVSEQIESKIQEDSKEVQNETGLLIDMESQSAKAKEGARKVIQLHVSKLMAKDKTSKKDAKVEKYEDISNLSNGEAAKYATEDLLPSPTLEPVVPFTIKEEKEGAGAVPAHTEFALESNRHTKKQEKSSQHESETEVVDVNTHEEEIVLKEAVHKSIENCGLDISETKTSWEETEINVKTDTQPKNGNENLKTEIAEVVTKEVETELNTYKDTKSEVQNVITKAEIVEADATNVQTCQTSTQAPEAGQRREENMLSQGQAVSEFTPSTTVVSVEMKRLSQCEENDSEVTENPQEYEADSKDPSTLLAKTYSTKLEEKYEIILQEKLNKFVTSLEEGFVKPKESTESHHKEGIQGKFKAGAEAKERLLAKKMRVGKQSEDMANDNGFEDIVSSCVHSAADRLAQEDESMHHKGENGDSEVALEEEQGLVRRKSVKDKSNSATSSGASTLKRNQASWRRSSKKKRKSVHVL